jgi:hypothetical protein
MSAFFFFDLGSNIYSYLPVSSPLGLKTSSEMGVGRNCSWLSDASLVKVSHKLRAKEWILFISI